MITTLARDNKPFNLLLNVDRISNTQGIEPVKCATLVFCSRTHEQFTPIALIF